MSDPITAPPATDPQSAPAPPVAPPQAPAVAAPATPPVASQAPASGVPAVDPSWLKSRLDETRATATRQAEQAYARKEAELQAKYEQVQTQLRALVGVQPPQNPEIDGIRAQFSKIYPGLSKMEDQAAKLEALLERSGDLEAQTNHYWTSYAKQTTERLYGTAEKSIGSPLTDDAKQVLHGSFVSFIESSPERTARYQNDPSIVEDFWKAFSSGFIDPARRTASAGVQTRVAASAALPQDLPGGVPRATPAPQPQNLDERVAAGWALYNQPKT